MVFAKVVCFKVLNLLNIHCHFKRNILIEIAFSELKFLQGSFLFPCSFGLVVEKIWENIGK